jgi:hypothetical protein
MADLKEKITQALEGLLTLQVKTVVTDVEHGDREISTEIRLDSGDITTRMHADFIGGELDAMRTFHAEQVSRGQKIIADHVKTLLDLVRELTGGGRQSLGGAVDQATGGGA